MRRGVSVYSLAGRVLSRVFNQTRPFRSAHRILLLTDSVGATQEISFVRPLQHDLDAGRLSLTIVEAKNFDKRAAELGPHLWREVSPTLLVMSRYSGGAHNSLVSLARRAQVPILYHIDDDLLAVPMEIGKAKFDHYNNSVRLSNLRGAMEAADLIYASTKPLLDRLREHGIKTPVQYGKIYCSIDVGSLPPLRRQDSLQTIGYMGTSGHAGDLATVVPKICELMEERPELRFETFGTIAPPSQLDIFGSRISHHAPINDYDAFLKQLRRLNWTVGLAPLQETPFNACKADTKWVEYTYAGIATVLENSQVYSRCASAQGALLASSPSDWKNRLIRLLDDQMFLERTRSKARQTLVDQYSTESLRLQIFETIEDAAQLARRPVING